MGKPIFREFSAVIKEPTPGAHVAGIIEHMLPFAAVGIELWRMLIDRLIQDFGAMREADLLIMSARPERLDTRPDRDALYQKVRDRTATLTEAVNKAEAMPRGWFGWTTTNKRRLSAVKKAAAELSAWDKEGAMKLLTSEAARLENRVRRQDKKIAEFDKKPEVQAAARRLDDYPGAIRMLEGVREIKPDKELHEAMRPEIRQDGSILRVDAPAALALLRKRVAIAAALRVAGSGKSGGGPKEVPTPDLPDIAPDEEVKPDDDRPEPDPLAGLLM
ncbi:hypothetical protein AAC691_17375 [Nguyenibacter vanlangensis]|uniref:Uncharacterized protein n=1 Tax=Nguyenibacter vanlangensis TaxID=1216886 RepID=A0ABZ3D2N2_9PROT